MLKTNRSFGRVVAESGRLRSLQMPEMHDMRKALEVSYLLTLDESFDLVFRKHLRMAVILAEM